MVIEVISSNTIKVILSQDDMSLYDVSFEKLDRSNPETKRLLLDLIDDIKEQKNVDLSSERLFVEAFPKDDGGCLLYLSMLNSNVHISADRPTVYNTLICTMSSPQSLMQVCSRIYEYYNHIVHNSELYYDNGTYQLILQIYRKTDRKLRTMLNEFCEISGSTDLEASVIREHYTCLFAIDAVEEINRKQIDF